MRLRILFFVMVLVLTGALLYKHSAHAFEYTLAEPLPGSEGTESALESYIKALFPFLLSVAAALAFVMLVYGGIRYMASAGNPETMKNARSQMLSAVFGLLLAALSVLILRTINPGLLSLQLPSLKETNPAAGSFGKSKPAPPPSSPFVYKCAVDGKEYGGKTISEAELGCKQGCANPGECVLIKAQ